MTPDNQPYSPGHVDAQGWDHRIFLLKWEHKESGLQGNAEIAGRLAPGEAELLLKHYHKTDHDNVYWFEAVPNGVSE